MARLRSRTVRAPSMADRVGNVGASAELSGGDYLQQKIADFRILDPLVPQPLHAVSEFLAMQSGAPECAACSGHATLHDRNDPHTLPSP